MDAEDYEVAILLYSIRYIESKKGWEAVPVFRNCAPSITQEAGSSSKSEWTIPPSESDSGETIGNSSEVSDLEPPTRKRPIKFSDDDTGEESDMQPPRQKGARQRTSISQSPCPNRGDLMCADTNPTTNTKLDESKPEAAMKRTRANGKVNDRLEEILVPGMEKTGGEPGKAIDNLARKRGVKETATSVLLSHTTSSKPPGQPEQPVPCPRVTAKRKTEPERLESNLGEKWQTNLAQEGRRPCIWSSTKAGLREEYITVPR